MALGRASVTSPDYPRGPADGTGTVSSGGREWAFRHVNVGNPQCVIEVGDEVEELDLAAIGPRDRVEHRAVPEPHQRLVHPRSTGRPCGRGSSSAGWGRRSPRARRQRRRGRGLPGRGAVTAVVELDGGRSRSRSPSELDVTLTGTASRVYAGELDRELVDALRDR